MNGNTKTKLLETAETIVRKRGFDGFSFADLSDAVGIRKASVHYHFPTKAALSTALLDRYRASLEEACEAIDRDHETASARLRALIEVYRDALDGGNMVCLCVSLTASRESLSVEALDRITAFRRMMTDWIADTFRCGITDGSIRDVKDPLSESQAMLATLEGAHMAARAAADTMLFDRSVALLQARFEQQI